MALANSNDSLEIVFEPLYPDVRVPSRRTEHSAGYDLYAYLLDRTVKIRDPDGTIIDREVPVGVLKLLPQEAALVPTGFRARLPQGYEAQIRIRSSIAFERGLMLPNAPGTIDADYPDEWLVMIKNDSLRPASINHGERVAQAVLAPYRVLTWRIGTVGVSTDRTGGLGSTGTA